MEQSSLPFFDLDAQPWRPPPIAPANEEAAHERMALLAALADSRLGTMGQKITYLLHNFPETRDSDTALAIRYWETFQAEILELWDHGSLDVLFELHQFETISRLRRHIQNDLGLFASTTRVGNLRREMQMEFYRYLAEQRKQDPEVRFYLDETGSGTSQPYAGVAGICVLDWRQYEMHHAALVKWRREQGWPDTLHFTEIGADASRHMALLAQLERRRSGLLFLGYSLRSKGVTNFALVDLFIQLIVDALKQARDLNCLTLVHAVTVFKEADQGFDQIHIPNLEKYLSEQMAREFPNLLYVRGIRPVVKGREPLLECADMIAGAMQRRALYGGPHPKDVLAEAVMNVTGFENRADKGAVFRAWPGA